MMKELFSIVTTISEKVKIWYSPEPRIVSAIEEAETCLIKSIRELAKILKEMMENGNKGKVHS